MAKEKKYLSQEDALAKAQRYCAYQDRCHQEVRYKLIEWGVYGDALERVIADLVSERFLDEERFARSYTRGKFRVKKWGRQRIQRELKRKEISAYCLRKAMEEIEEEDYRATLLQVLQKRDRLLRESNPYKRKQKIIQYGIQRGYEISLVYEIYKELKTD